MQWVHTGKRKLCTRLNLLFDGEDEANFHARVAKATVLRAQFEADARYFLFTTEQIGQHAVVSDLSAVIDESALKRRIVKGDEVRKDADGPVMGALTFALPSEADPPSSPPPLFLPVFLSPISLRPRLPPSAPPSPY